MSRSVPVDRPEERGADVSSAAEAHSAIARLALDVSAAPHAIAKIFDELTPETRTEVVRHFTKSEQRALYEKSRDFAPLTLSDLVPPQIGDLQEVRHLGLNTLPAFRVFEKRFCRPVGEDLALPSALVGYNFQKMSPVTGPGYFVAVEDDARPEVLIDYRRLPTRVPEGWPGIRSNERGLARWVYGFMVDRLRRVSEHVTVGSAARNGRELGSYFVLNRAD